LFLVIFFSVELLRLGTFLRVLGTFRGSLG
jgi:hypothetical protein